VYKAFDFEEKKTAFIFFVLKHGIIRNMVSAFESFSFNNDNAKYISISQTESCF